LVSAKAGKRGRPKKILSRPRGRPRKASPRKIGRPPWDLASDKDRFAVVATHVLSADFKFTERSAAQTAIEIFGRSSTSIETIRWKARKARKILASPRKAPGAKDQAFNSNLWKTARWFQLMRIAVRTAIRKTKKEYDYHRVSQITALAKIVGESAFAQDVLVALVHSGFGLRSPRELISDDMSDT